MTVCLRLQVNPQNKNEFYGISPERGFADFIFAHVVLHLVITFGYDKKNNGFF